MLSMDRGPDTGRGLGAPAWHLSLTGLGWPRDRDMRPVMRPDHTRGQTSRVSRTRVSQDPVRQLNIIFTCTLLIRTRGESMVLVLSLD